MSDQDITLDILQNLSQDYHGLPLVELGIEMYNLFGLRPSFHQIDAIIHRKRVGWFILDAWSKSGISQPIIKELRKHMMRIDP